MAAAPAAASPVRRGPASTPSPARREAVAVPAANVWDLTNLSTFTNSVRRYLERKENEEY